MFVRMCAPTLPRTPFPSMGAKDRAHLARHGRYAPLATAASSLRQVLRRRRFEAEVKPISFRPLCGSHLPEPNEMRGAR
jgi:hypothetical protein